MASTVATRFEDSCLQNGTQRFVDKSFKDYINDVDSGDDSSYPSRQLSQGDAFLLTKTGCSLLSVLSKCDLSVRQGKSRYKRRSEMTPLQLSKVRERDRLNQQRRRAKWRGMQCHGSGKLDASSNCGNASACLKKTRAELPYNELIRLREKERMAQQFRRQRLRLFKTQAMTVPVANENDREETLKQNCNEIQNFVTRTDTTEPDLKLKIQFMHALGLVQPSSAIQRAESRGKQELPLPYNDTGAKCDSSGSHPQRNNEDILTPLKNRWWLNGKQSNHQFCSDAHKTEKCSTSPHNLQPSKIKRIKRESLSMEELERLRARERMAKRRQRARIRQRLLQTEHSEKRLSSSLLSYHRKLIDNLDHLSSSSSLDLLLPEIYSHDKEPANFSVPTQRSGVSDINFQPETDTFRIMRTRRSKPKLTGASLQTSTEGDFTTNEEEASKIQWKSRNKDSDGGHSRKELMDDCAHPSEFTATTIIKTENSREEPIQTTTEVMSPTDVCKDTSDMVIDMQENQTRHSSPLTEPCTDLEETKRAALLGLGLCPRSESPRISPAVEEDEPKTKQNFGETVSENNSAAASPHVGAEVAVDDGIYASIDPDITADATEKSLTGGCDDTSSAQMTQKIPPSECKQEICEKNTNFAAKDRDSCIESSVSFESVCDESSEHVDTTEKMTAQAAKIFTKERSLSSLSISSVGSGDLNTSNEQLVPSLPLVSARHHRRKRDICSQNDDSQSSGLGEEDSLDSAVFNENEIFHSSFDETTGDSTGKISGQGKYKTEGGVVPKSLVAIHDLVYGKGFENFTSESPTILRSSRVQRAMKMEDESRPISEKWKKWKSGLTAEQLERRRRSNREAQRRRRARLKCAELGLAGKIPETISYRRNPVSGRRSPPQTLEEAYVRGNGGARKGRDKGGSSLSMALEQDLTSSSSTVSRTLPVTVASDTHVDSLKQQGMMANVEEQTGHLPETSFRGYSESLLPVTEASKDSVSVYSHPGVITRVYDRGMSKKEDSHMTPESIVSRVELKPGYQRNKPSDKCQSQEGKYGSVCVSTSKGKGCRIKVTPQRKVELPRMDYVTEKVDGRHPQLRQGDEEHDLMTQAERDSTLSSSWNYKSLLLKSDDVSKNPHRLESVTRWPDRTFHKSTCVAASSSVTTDPFMSSLLSRITSETSDSVISSRTVQTDAIDFNRNVKTGSKDGTSHALKRDVTHYPGTICRHSSDERKNLPLYYRRQLASGRTQESEGSVRNSKSLQGECSHDTWPKSRHSDIDHHSPESRQTKTISKGESSDEIKTDNAQHLVAYSNKTSSLDSPEYLPTLYPGREESSTRGGRYSQSGAQVLTTLKQIAEMDYVSRYLASKEPISSYRCDDQALTKTNDECENESLALSKRKLLEITECISKEDFTPEGTEGDSQTPTSSKRRKQCKPRKLAGGNEA